MRLKIEVLKIELNTKEAVDKATNRELALLKL